MGYAVFFNHINQHGKKTCSSSIPCRIQRVPYKFEHVLPSFASSARQNFEPEIHTALTNTRSNGRILRNPQTKRSSSRQKKISSTCVNVLCLCRWSFQHKQGQARASGKLDHKNIRLHILSYVSTIKQDTPLTSIVLATTEQLSLHNVWLCPQSRSSDVRVVQVRNKVKIIISQRSVEG